MSWQIIRPQIKTLLSTISTLQEVTTSPTMKFQGYPSAHVIPSANESAYETTTENVRTYAFTIRVFYETKHTGVGEALSALEEVVDSILDLFDQEDLKGSDTRTVGINLPSGYTFLNMWAIPSTWGEVSDQELIMSEIIVKVRLSRDIS